MADGSEMRRILAETSAVRRRLSFTEIVEAGLPAAYCEFGERLVYLDGKLLDARQPDAAVEIPIDGGVGLDKVVGIEFGWRHVSACECRFCARWRAQRAA